jgi:hypothetical protein
MESPPQPNWMQISLGIMASHRLAECRRCAEITNVENSENIAWQWLVQENMFVVDPRSEEEVENMLRVSILCLHEYRKEQIKQ